MGGATPSKARPQEASAEPPMAAPTPCHHLPSGPGPLGASGQMGLRIRPASAPPLIQATNTPRWPPLPCLPVSLQVPPGASRSGPELVQVTHPCHGHSTPTSPPKVKENQGTENCGWCPLVGLEDALLEAPGTEVEGKGAEDLHQNNWERPSARLAAPPPSCPPWSSRGSLGQL